MESKLEESNATPLDGDASTLAPLDRIERMLSAEDGPVETPELEGDGTAENVEPDDGGVEKANEPQITTSDLAKYLGVDEAALDLDEDGTVKFKTKIDGSDGTAKLSDFLKSYQLEGHVNKRNMEIAEKEKAILSRQQEVERQFSEKLQYAEGLANIAANQLLAEYQSINWPSLEQQDPGQAALLRQKFQERQAELRGVVHNIEQNKANQHQKSVHERQQMLAQQAEKLPQVIPEWKDQAVATKERSEIREWALKQGFQAQEVDSVAMAAHVAVMRKAMLYDKLQSTKPAIENKVRLAPKLVKPGQPAQNSQEMELRNLKHAVKKSGGKNGSLAAYLIATGKV
jgi:hypothetical protein